MRSSIKYLFFWLWLFAPFCANAAELVDPTRPPDSQFVTKPVNAGQPLSLTAIFIYPNYRLAIINGQPLMVGDHINEFTITAITPFTVELMRSQDSKEVLSLTLTVKRLRSS